MELELKLGKEKIKTGQMRMAETYIESINSRIKNIEKKEDEKADASERAEGAATAAESLLSEPSSAEAVLEPPALVAVPPAKDAPPEPAARRL